MLALVVALSVVGYVTGTGMVITTSTTQQKMEVCTYCQEHCQVKKAGPDFEYEVCSDSRYVPLREFLSTVPPDFHYTSTWNEGSHNSYWHLGELARVAKSPLKGTVPLTRYWNGRNNRLSTQPLTGGWNPWTDANYAQTYIYSEPKEGTFGLYAFNRGPVQRLALDYNINVMENMGWTNEGLLGYVYRPCPSPHTALPAK